MAAAGTGLISVSPCPWSGLCSRVSVGLCPSVWPLRQRQLAPAAMGRAVPAAGKEGDIGHATIPAPWRDPVRTPVLSPHGTAQSPTPPSTLRSQTPIIQTAAPLSHQQHLHFPSRSCPQLLVVQDVTQGQCPVGLGSTQNRAAVPVGWEQHHKHRSHELTGPQGSRAVLLQPS